MLMRHTNVLLLVAITIYVRAAFSEDSMVGVITSYMSECLPVRQQANSADEPASNQHCFIDIVPLWKTLGISVVQERDAKHVFGCRAGGEFCHLSDPVLDVFERKDVVIIRLTDSQRLDYQYFILNEGKFICHFDVERQKYQPPVIEFLDDDLFALTTLEGSGTGMISYVTRFYQVSSEGIDVALTVPVKQHRVGWGTVFDYELLSEYTYFDNTLQLDYYFVVTYGEGETGEDVENLGVSISARRTLVLTRARHGFDINNTLSDISLSQLLQLDLGDDIDYYQIFKPEFDALQLPVPEIAERLNDLAASSGREEVRAVND